MHAAGTVRETYHAAIQHDIVDLPGDAHLAGVVRRPTGWFRSTIDENYRALGPPEKLLTETKDRQETFQQRGMCAEEAHNAAWQETGFADRYRNYLESSAEADRALDDLADRVRDGQTVVLVCFEGESKRCHRHALVDELQARLA
jgi:hypothetical protein